VSDTGVSQEKASITATTYDAMVRQRDEVKRRAEAAEERVRSLTEALRKLRTGRVFPSVEAAAYREYPTRRREWELLIIDAALAGSVVSEREEAYPLEPEHGTWPRLGESPPSPGTPSEEKTGLDL
jgi:hypothetical protein